MNYTSDLLENTRRIISGEINSPLRIELLLHCHTTPAPHERYEALADEIYEFIRMGVIESTEQPNVYRTTKLGQAWVEALCKVPPPRPVFQDHAGNIIAV